MIFILITVIWTGAGARMETSSVFLRQYIHPLPGFSSQLFIQDMCAFAEHPQVKLCDSTGTSCERQIEQSSSVVGTRDADFIVTISRGRVPLETGSFNFY